MLGRPLVQAADLREGGHRVALLLIAFHRAVGQPQGERGVGIAAGPFEREPRFGDLPVCLLLDFILVLEPLAQRPHFGIDGPREIQHRVGNRFQGVRPPVVELVAQRHVLEPGAVDQFGGAVARTLARQRLPHQRVILPEFPREGRQRIGQGGDFQVVVDRLLREQPQFERGQAGIAEVRQAGGVGHGLLRRGAHQRAGDAEKRGVEGGRSAPALQSIEARGELGDHALRTGNFLVSRGGFGVIRRVDPAAQAGFLRRQGGKNSGSSSPANRPS